MAISLKSGKHTSARTASRLRRQMRGRKKLSGPAERPRLGGPRSSTPITAQGVADLGGQTLASASTMETDGRGLEGDKSAKARKVGELVAERAKAAGVETAVFDRAGNKYHGRIAALAEGAREGGLAF